VTDRITLTQPVVMRVQGQPMVVLGGSQLDVPSAAAFAASHITNVQLGTGVLLNGVHSNPVANFRAR
jgi:hypothetical protein